MERRQGSTDTRTTVSSVAQRESSWTDESNFTDSAVEMDATRTPPLKPASIEDGDRTAQSLSPITQSFADRMRRLAAAAWTLEQDDDMSDSKRQQIGKMLRSLEAVVEDDEPFDIDNIQLDTNISQVHEQAVAEQQVPEIEANDFTEDGFSESDLFQIHNSLAEVVTSMRLRQQEQRHLHQLTVTKLEAVAQRYLFQEQQLQNLAKELKSLRTENQSIGQENDKLRGVIAELESEATKKEVAVSAMTSAVAGLEGWIEDADKALPDQHAITTPSRGSRPRRAITRGKGRFRGRYFVDEESGSYFPTSPDARELQDGVRAWIRGFRDVEDACSSPIPGHLKEQYRGSIEDDRDEWGDFESPVNTPS